MRKRRAGGAACFHAATVTVRTGDTGDDNHRCRVEGGSIGEVVTQAGYERCSCCCKHRLLEDLMKLTSGGEHHLEAAAILAALYGTFGLAAPASG